MITTNLLPRREEPQMHFPSHLNSSTKKKKKELMPLEVKKKKENET